MAKFRGTLELVSDAVIDGWNGMATIHALRIGDKVLRAVRTDPSLHSLLEPGEDATLATGRLLWWRWLLRIEVRGATHRHGVLSFLFFNVLHAVLGGMAIGVFSALGISSISTQSDIAVLGGLVLFALNLKTWLR